MNGRRGSSAQWMFCALAFCMMALVSGCGGGSRESQLIGTWKMKPVDVPAAATGNAASQMGAAMAKQMLGNSTIEFKQDKTFVMTMLFPMEGTWTIDESSGVAQLNMTKMMGMDLSKMPNADKQKNQPMMLQMSSDNKQLSVQNKSGTPNPMGGEMTFEKQ